jgi:hypothetical protein
MKITRRQLRKIIKETMVGFPDKAPFDAGGALKSAKKKITKEPVTKDMFSDDKDYDAKRQAYSLGALTADLTDDEQLAADMASDVITHKSFDVPGPDYDIDSTQLDPDQRFFAPEDHEPIEQPLQGTVNQIIPELQISKYSTNPRLKQDTTTYHTPDKKYKILMSFREEFVDEEEPQFSEPSSYGIEVRKYNPKSKQYEIGSPSFPGPYNSNYRDGTKAFFTLTSGTTSFISELKRLKKYLQDLGSL